MLWDPSSKDVGMDPSAAAAYLKSLPRGWAGSSGKDCNTYADKNIDKLNGEFRVCAAKFLKAYTAQHGAVTITSGHRDGEEAKCVCVGEPGMCGFLKVDTDGKPIGGRGVGHQYGTAIDVWPFTPAEVKKYSNDQSQPVNDTVEKIQKFARDNPQFGVHFPFGMRDRPHLEPTGKGCGTSATQPPASPFGFGNQFRSLLGGSPESGGNTNTPRNLLGGSPSAPAPQTSQPAAQPAHTQPTQYFPPQQMPTQPIPPLISVEPLSTSEQLAHLSKTTSASGTPTKGVPIVINPYDRGGIESKISPETTVVITMPLPPSPQTTFTQTPPTTVTENEQQTLSRLRSVLERIRQLLTPFGSRTFIAP